MTVLTIRCLSPKVTHAFDACGEVLFGGGGRGLVYERLDCSREMHVYVYVYARMLGWKVHRRRTFGVLVCARNSAHLCRNSIKEVVHD